MSAFRGASHRRPSFMGSGSLFFLLAALCLSVAAHAQRQASRVMPPPALECDRNQLTSYNGALVHYSVRDDATLIEIATEWDTLETIRVPHSGDLGPATAYTFHGLPFTQDHWKKLGTDPAARLPTKGTPLIAWVCLDGETPPVIDWRP